MCPTQQCKHWNVWYHTRNRSEPLQFLNLPPQQQLRWLKLPKSPASLQGSCEQSATKGKNWPETPSDILLLKRREKDKNYCNWFFSLVGWFVFKLIPSHLPSERPDQRMTGYSNSLQDFLLGKNKKKIKKLYLWETLLVSLSSDLKAEVRLGHYIFISASWWPKKERN